MTAGLSENTPTTRPHSFPDSLLPPLPTPILQEKRDLVTGPMQPDDVQRIIAHVAFTRCGGRHTFVFRPSFAYTLPLCTLWAAHFPVSPQHGDLKSIPISSFFRHYVQGDERTFLEDVSREKGGADVRLKVLTVSLPGIDASSF